VSQIVTWVKPLPQEQQPSRLSNRWARVYDRTGAERFAVALITRPPDRLATNEHAAFAAGFDAVAGEVLTQTGVKVGFFLDPLPPGTYAPGIFHPTPEGTGPHLRTNASILGHLRRSSRKSGSVQPTPPTLVNWKRDFARRWRLAGLPFLADVSPGYDAHLIFGASAAPPYGHTPQWRSELAAFVADHGSGGTLFNSWNGYTERWPPCPPSNMAAQISRGSVARRSRCRAASKPNCSTAMAKVSRIMISRLPNDGGVYRATPVDLEAASTQRRVQRGLDQGRRVPALHGERGRALGCTSSKCVSPQRARAALFTVEFDGADKTGQ